MTLILFTTTDLAGGRDRDFRRLLASVERSRDVAVRHYVLLQNASEEALALCRSEAPAACRIFAISGRASVSAARNRLIAEACTEQVPAEGDVVAFPDDDCWFPDGFLARLHRTFAEATTLDLLVCRMSLDPRADEFRSRDAEPIAAHQVVRMSSSNNMFLRGSLAGGLGAFDEGLGLGSPAGGGEDTDYALRAYLGARRAGLLDQPLVGHPVPDRASAAKYFRGAMTVLARHARARPTLARECARKVLVGGWFVGSGRLAASEYLIGLRDGAGALLAARPTTPEGPVR